MNTHTYAHEYTCACMTLSTRWSTDTETHNLCTNMHTHTHTHVYKRIDVQIHTHMHIHTYIHVSTHTHIHIYAHTHTKCTYETHASTPGTTARQRTCKEPLQTKEALHVSFVRRNQPTFRTSNARTSLYPRPAAPIPLQRCSRAAVREHAGIQAREWSKWLFTRNEGSMKNNQPLQAAHHANHDSAAPRQHLLICTGAEPIQQFHGQPTSRAPESILWNRITFPPFSRRNIVCLPVLGYVNTVTSRTYKRHKKHQIYTQTYIERNAIWQLYTGTYLRSSLVTSVLHRFQQKQNVEYTLSRTRPDTIISEKGARIHSN